MEMTSGPYDQATTALIAEAMLKERVPAYLTDSGAVYGRAWERNVGKALNAQPDAWGEFRVIRVGDGPGRLEMLGTVSLYHWLNKHLEFDPVMQRRFDEFCEAEETGGLAAAEEFGDHLVATGEATETVTDYTYNYPDWCHLSQNVHYTVVDLEDRGQIVILSVHGGCDARMGFTEPKVFRPKDCWDVAREGMHISGVGGTDNTWFWQGWNQLDPSSMSEVTQEICDIPAFQLNWFDGEPAIEAIVLAIEAAPSAKESLRGTTLQPASIERACRVIDEQVGRLELERRDLVVQTLAAEHPIFFLCHDKKAWLFFNSPDRFADGEPIEFFVD